MLTTKQLAEIKALQEICEQEGGFQLKLNFEMLKRRSGLHKEDFFHYEDQQLVGFLGCYGFGNKVELCGMVHPEYRRKGIFSGLWQLALDEIKTQNYHTVLLNAPTDSQTAKEFLQTVPCIYLFSEYQMQWKPKELLEDTDITLRTSSSPEDFEAEIQLEVQCFGFAEKEAREYNQSIRKSQSEFNLMIEADGKTAGKMRVSEKNNEAWIYGFAVFPELQGKGIGRKALSNVVRMENRKGLPIFLEVEAKNAHALGLYESCGFKAYHSQDYYQLLLS